MTDVPGDADPGHDANRESPRRMPDFDRFAYFPLDMTTSGLFRPIENAVALGLVKIARDRQSFRTTTKDIAAASRCSIPTVRRALRKITESGWIEAKPTTGRGGGVDVTLSWDPAEIDMDEVYG